MKKMLTLTLPNNWIQAFVIGKVHALKKYGHFALNIGVKIFLPFLYSYAKYFDIFGTFGVISDVLLHCPKTSFSEYLVPGLSVSSSIIFKPKGPNYVVI